MKNKTKLRTKRITIGPYMTKYNPESFFFLIQLES